MYKHKKVFYICLLLLVPSMLGSMVSVNPATNEEEMVLISASKEREIGRKLCEQVKKAYSLPVDPLVQKRVEEIGRKLASGSDRKDLVYWFTVLKDKKKDNYNAFALPGGYVYIFSDLVEVLETDDNIAAVLAHEIGHIEARHSVKRLQGSLAATVLMLAVAQTGTDSGSYESANIAMGQLLSAYSRKDERQADELSLKYVKLAGFNSTGIIGALTKLKEIRKDGPRMMYASYKSHPYVSERIAYLKTHINGYTDFDSYINLVAEKE
ncbi:MAG: M48 family metalloprotease [Candidatus Omnitrophica bacterium]|nr:M48 family metalloprotease [Candidatus Omnitrophota bacterium]